MKIWLFIIICFLFSNSVFTSEITIIKLHNQSIDQALLNNLEESQEDSELNEVNILDNNIDQESDGNVEENYDDANVEESDLDTNVEENDNEAKITISDENLSTVNEVILLPDLWKKTNEEDLNFLLDNITDINSPTLRYELLSLLNIDNLPPKNLDKVDFENLVIRSLLKFGDRDKAYKIFNTFSDPESTKYNLFYKEFELNYLLSTYNLSEACDFRNNFKNTDLTSNNNYFLKIDIFCLILEENFNEANLLNALLQETGNINDEYFQYLYDKLNQPNLEDSDPNSFEINEKEIFLYSAMHRVGNIALSQKLLQLDPINLS